MEDGISNEDILKKYLFKLPKDNEFNFTPDVRREIRKTLFMSISNQGKYLGYFFPDISSKGNNGGRGSESDGEDEIEQSSENVVERVRDEYQWSYTEYFRSSMMARDGEQNKHNLHAFHSNRPCVRIFRKGEPIYRCLTCGFDDTCALCSHCFAPRFHEGHKVHITVCQRENGGVCDCGDPEAWLREFACPFSSGESIVSEEAFPQELEDVMFSTFETILDFVIDVMSQSYTQFKNPESLSQSDIEKCSLNSSLEAKKYGWPTNEVVDSNSNKYFLMIYNDQIRQYRDAVQRIHLASKKVKQFAVMVTNELQTKGKAKVIGSSDIKLLQERQKILSATGLCTCIRSYRDVFREDMCDEILSWLHDLTDSEVFKTSDTFKGLFCKAFCKKWRSGLLFAGDNRDYTYKAGTLDTDMNIPKIQKYQKVDGNDYWKFVPSRWELPPEICQECEYNLDISDYDPSSSHLGSRIQYLIYLDIRLWKSARFKLHKIYSTSLIVDLKYKNIISCQYVDIYPTVADMFLTIDREPELNIMCTLSTQLFTCPSNSTSIMRHGDLARIFASIYGFLTSESIGTPESVKVPDVISMNSLKNRRWGQIFFDIDYILSRTHENQPVLDGNIIPMACGIISLFQGKPVMKRESKNHVEYESSDYTAFFHAISVIYQFGEYISKRLNYDRDKISKLGNFCSEDSIAYVIKFLLNLEKDAQRNQGDISSDTDVSTGPRNVIVEPISKLCFFEYRIDIEKVSFLHPMHSFLSWLLELSKFESTERILQVFLSSCSPDESQTSLTMIFDYPLRTTVLMSQIKSGFWVRNGFSVRSQLQLYRNTGLRESGYLRDLFSIQTFISICDPDLVSYFIFNRWLFIDGWMSEVDNKLYHQSGQPLAYDKKTLSYMLEECCSFLIHVITEDSNLRGLKEEDVIQSRIKSEIVHSLCFGPMNYTKLCSSVPEHIVSDKRFDIMLKELTIFSSPSTSNDIGIYKLKEEHFDDINPYYFSLTANIKEDAIKLVKERLLKKFKKPIDECVIFPKLSNPSDLGPLRYVANFSTSIHFCNFLIRSLTYVIKEGENQIDNLLEIVLHLIHVCSYEQAIDITKYGTFYEHFIGVKDDSNESVASLLYHILENEKLKLHHAKIRVIYRIFQNRYNDLYEKLDHNISGFDLIMLEINKSEDTGETEFDRKKRIAKERKAKLMAKFKKQQSSFIQKNAIDNSNTSDADMDEYDDETGWRFPEPHCILCQNASEDYGPFGIISHISKSSEFRLVPFDDPYWFLKSFSDNHNLDDDEYNPCNDNERSEEWKLYMKKVKKENVIGPGFSDHSKIQNRLVSSSCGHGMHFQCYMNFLNSSKSRSSQITRNTPENSDHREFLCPLCKAINNSFIPILWTVNKKSLKNFLKSNDNPDHSFDIFKDGSLCTEDSFHKFANMVEADVEASSILSPMNRESIAKEMVSSNKEESNFRPLLSNMFQVLNMLTFPHVFKADSAFILSNSVKSAEIALRGLSSNNELVILQLSNYQMINLRTLHEFRNTCLLMKAKNWIMTANSKREAFVKILSDFFFFGSDLSTKAILEEDYFERLVTIVPLPTLGLSFNSILRRCFFSHMLQTMHILVDGIVSHNYYESEDFSIFDVPCILEVDDEVKKISIQIFELLKNASTQSVDDMYDSKGLKFGQVFYTLLIKALTPFLRRAAIFSYVVCAEIDELQSSKYSGCSAEADKLCSFMNIYSIEDCLRKIVTPGDKYNQDFSTFLNFMNNSRSLNPEQIDIKRQLEYPGVIKLIDLPERLDLFFTNYYYSDKYQNPHKAIEDPAVCLFCAHVVDVQKEDIGSREGQCTTHFLRECANTIGIFLLPKERSFLLMHKNGGSFYSAPFLDQHGELPGDTKRGNTLHLMRPRYDDFIRNVWLSHNIPNYIVRKLDSVIDSGGWDTL